LPETVLDFWRWRYSDLINNATRGELAEFIVALSLGLPIDEPCDRWNKFDLLYHRCRIQVKSAAYHQRWRQEAISKIVFQIGTSLGWDAATNKQDTVAARHADAYVLCLLAEKDRSLVDPMDWSQWLFWVVPVEFLAARKRSQHSITEKSLRKEVGNPIGADGIKQAMDAIVKQLPPE
jgi:hypothetical protein